MNMFCSVCGEDECLKLLESKAMPGARYIACESCRLNKFEPRPLVVLGAYYFDSPAARNAIKEKLYVGEEILASETTR